MFNYLLMAFMMLGSLTYAYSHNMMQLVTPAQLEKGLFVYGIGHHFYGPLSQGDQFDSLLGMDDGANVKMDFRYALSDHLDVRVSRTRYEKEWTLGMAYSAALTDYSNYIVMVDGFSYKVNEDRRQNVVSVVGVNFPYLLSTLTPSVMIAYDGYHETAGAGLGLEWGIMESVSWITEYYTRNNRYGLKNAWLSGVKVETFGHRFEVYVHNAPQQLHFRRLLLGSPEDEIYLGFRISRLLEF